jgi:hypothetical protein
VVSDPGIALSGSQGESDEGLSAKTPVRKKNDTILQPPEPHVSY